MQIKRSLILFASAAALAACASGGAGTITPAALARLERARASNPRSESAVRALGIGYYKADRFADARRALEEAVRLDPRDGAAALYLGLTAEKQQDYPAARAAYSSYVRYGRTARVRRQLEARLAALTRLELQVAARSAIQRETELSQVPGSPTTVAVMPMKFTGADSSLQPLERGLTELITTDLARSSKLTVVERARLQALVDEMALQQSGAADASTTVRAGKLIQAGRLVQGAINQQGQDLRVDAAIVDVGTSRVSGSATDSRSLDELFTLEKNLVLRVFDEMDVELTVAERNMIEQRPTRSLQAFLAYSRGLEAEDQGRYDDAARFFGEAVRIDPGFGQAAQANQQAQAASQGSQMTANTVETSLQGTQEGSIANQAASGNSGDNGSAGAGNTVGTVAEGLNGSPAGTATGGSGDTGTQGPGSVENKDASNGSGTSDPGSGTATISIIIPRPKP